MFKKFILGSLLVAGLTACPIVEPPIEPAPKSPIAKDDVADTGIAQNKTIKPYENDEKGDAELVRSSIDLNVNVEGQQFSFKDPKGTFTLNTSTGEVTFAPAATAKAGEFASTRYTIKDTNGKISSAATIKVTIAGTAPTGPIRVLFIGNSRTWYRPCTSGYTAYNIPDMLQSMAASESRPLQITYVATVDCGLTLKQHLNGYYLGSNFYPGDALPEIQKGGWNFVVLQPHTDETGSASALQSTVQSLNAEIIKVGAKTVLSENWWLKGAKPSLTTITNTTKTVASSFSSALRIAPIGSAWSFSTLIEDALFNNDGLDPSNNGLYKHSTPLGAYVAASAYYAMFYPNKEIPTTLPPGLSITATDANSARKGARDAYTALEIKYK